MNDLNSEFVRGLACGGIVMFVIAILGLVYRRPAPRVECDCDLGACPNLHGRCPIHSFRPDYED
ncbi:MAG TPA: hypothetical protein VGX76_00345 [Pirellulales bacterium]|jgi:hypothetical protein|nr:hypothetical protein [Pirellulales bacterium]